MIQRMAENVNRLQFAAGDNRNVWRVSKELLCTTADIGKIVHCKLSAADLAKFFVKKLDTIKTKVSARLY